MKERSQLTKYALLSLLLLFVGSPAIISLDPWDAFPDSGDTAVFLLCAVALCLGISLLLTRSFKILRRLTTFAVHTFPSIRLANNSKHSLQRSLMRTLMPLRI